MKYAIFSDVHANLAALERVLRDAQGCGAERFVCLGDIVGYGPMPVEAVARVRSIAHLVLAGNHDDAVSGRMDASDFIDLAGEAVLRHRSALSSSDIAYLKSLPRTAEIEGAALAHGEFTDPAAFNYMDSPEVAAANFEATQANLMFVGHTHVPEMFIVGASGTVHRLPPQDFVREDGKRYIVNVGSVGYPRECNGSCMSSYVIYDTADMSVRFRFLPFSVASVMQRGKVPKFGRATLFAAAAAIVAAGCAIAFAMRRESPPDAAKTVEAAPAERPFMEKRITIAPSCHGVKANLKVDGAPVKLSIVFKDASNEVLGGGETLTVKHSNRKTVKVPSGATVAVFEIWRMRPGDEPHVVEFRPEALMNSR